MLARHRSPSAQRTALTLSLARRPPAALLREQFVEGPLKIAVVCLLGQDAVADPPYTKFLFDRVPIDHSSRSLGDDPVRGLSIVGARFGREGKVTLTDTNDAVSSRDN